MTDDAELLRRYAREASPSAFDELVQRHVALVYHTALRQTGGEAERAREVTQSVFADLARRPASVAGGESVVGWLHTTTNRLVAPPSRGEMRRSRPERVVASGGSLGNAATVSDPETTRLAGVIDDAVEMLAERERELLLLRFFEGRPFAEIGDLHFVSEEAARVRVDRALERLADALSEQGVSLEPPALAGALEQFGARSAPSGIAASVSSTALQAARSGAGPVNGATRATNRSVVIAAGAVALLGLAFGAYHWQRATRLEAALDAAQRDAQNVLDEQSALQARLESERRRAQAADEDNARLIEAMNRVAQSQEAETAAAPEAPLTPEAVTTRFRQAGELARAGRFDEALREYLWCFDEGMPRFAVFATTRSGALLTEWAELARRHAPAREALRLRREQAEQRMRANANDHEAAGDFAALNDALGESVRTLREFERLSRNDPRREALGARVFEPLVTQKRYADALRARSYATMRAGFELGVGVVTDGAAARPTTATGGPRARTEARQSLVRTTARDIEVLAGAGDLAHARSLAEGLLEFDPSLETQALLQQHLARAGQPGLFER